MRKIHNKLVLGILTLCVLNTTNIHANNWGSGETGSLNTVFIPGAEWGTYKFNPKNSTVQKEGYFNLYKDTLFHKVTYGDKVPVSVYLPTDVPKTIDKYTSGSAGSLIKRYTKANTLNVAGQGGEHLISSNDWNAKKGQVADVYASAGYAGDNTGFVDINGYKGELRYIGYLSDGSQVDNPYFPNDITNNKNPWDKDWKYFGVQTASGKKHTPTMYNKAPNLHVAEEVFNYFINYTEFGKNMVKKDPKWADWQTWNKYFSIQQDNDGGLSYQITGFYLQDYIRYQTFTIAKPINASTYIMGLNLTPSKKPEEKVASVDFVEGQTSAIRSGDPFYQGLRSWPTSQRAIEELPILNYGEDYDVNGFVKYYSKKDNVSTNYKNWTPTYVYIWKDKDGNTTQTKTSAIFKEALISNKSTPTESYGKLVWPSNGFIPVELEVWMKLPTNELRNADDDTVTDDNQAVIKFKIGDPNDMAIPDLDLLKDGKPTKFPTPNQEHEVIVDVENLGNKPVTDPTVDVVIKDKNNNPFFQETITIPGTIEPGQTVQIPVKPVIPPNNAIQVCAVINTKHTDALENIANENDKRCEEFKIVQDIGVSQDIILKGPDGKTSNEFIPGELNTIIFKPKHVVGPEAVGLDPISNPMATIDVTIKDATGKVFVNKTLAAKDVLQPGGMVEVPVFDVKSNTHEITACATINKKNTDAGYNIVNENDTACKTFSAIKNYSMRELLVNPSLVMPPKGVTTINQPLNFTFTFANEAKGNTTDNPLVVLKQDGKEIWKENVAIGRGDVVTKNIRVETKLTGNTKFEVIVNPNKTEREFKPNTSDPYADNAKQTALTLKLPANFKGCETNRTTSNKWKERITYTKQYQNTQYYTCHHYDDDGDHDGCHEVSYCPTPRKTDVKTVDKDYFERYEVKKIEVRSKWSKDNASKYNHISSDGWADVTNGGVFKVKAGYPIELRVTSNYTTNRNTMPSTPTMATGTCYNGPVEISEKPRELFVNSNTYVKMPNSNEFIELTGSVKGNWYDATAVRQFPSRPNLSGSGNINAVYVGNNTKPGKYTVGVYTNVHPGYQPSNVVSGTLKPLQDCASFQIEVLANNDLGSHITD